MHRDFRKPLVLMTPKSLLRHELAVSSIEDLVEGTCELVIGDDVTADRRDSVRQMILCSGKIYYALAKARSERMQRGQSRDVAIARVEQLYPFPEPELASLLRRHPRLSRVLWVQEEPQNMGAWRSLRHRFE